MRVLIACEFSGVVRRAFLAHGHEAYSCDLLPAEDGEVHHHIIGDVAKLLDPTRFNVLWWDLLIAHPPCTYLTNSGVRWLFGGKGATRDPERWKKMEAGAAFFLRLLNAPINRIAVENPIMHKYAREIIGLRPDQIIQPWMFGHGESKATGLWLRGLPPLKPTRIVEGRTPRVHFASPGPDRWKERSRTLTGIAEAMAEQWGNVTSIKR